MRGVVFFILLLAIRPFCNGNIDSLQVVAEQRDTNAVKACIELGKKYTVIGLDSSLLFLRRGVKLAEELDYDNGRLTSYRIIGALAVHRGGYEESVEHLERALQLVDEKKMPLKEKVDVFINLGVAHSYVNKLGEAIEVYLEAVQICRANDLKNREARLMNNLGVFYRKLQEYDKAVDIYHQSYDLRVSLKDTLGMANNLFNLTAVLAKLNRHEESLSALDRAQSLYEYLGRDADIFSCKLSRGIALHDLKRNEDALKELLPLSEKGEDVLTPQEFTHSNLALAEIMFEKKAYAKALVYLSKLDQVMTDSDFTEELSLFYTLKSNTYAKLNNKQAAFDYIVKRNEIQEKLNEKSNLSFKEEMLAKYETVEKDYRIELLNKEKSISELKIKSQQNRNIFLGLGLGVMSLICFLLYKLYQKLTVKNDLLQKSEHQKSILLKEIHHRVKNNLQVISSLLSLQATKVSDDTTKEALRTSKSRVQSMSLLHQNLYNRENLTSVNAEEYISNLTENLLDLYKVDMEVGMNLDIDSVELDVDSLIPIGLIINETVCNAIKYAFENKPDAEISIQFKEQKDGFLLGIKDNGIGLPAGKLQANKDSLGTKLIESFVEKLDAVMTVRNDNGAEFGIVIPKSSLVVS